MKTTGRHEFSGEYSRYNGVSSVPEVRGGGLLRENIAVDATVGATWLWKFTNAWSYEPGEISWAIGGLWRKVNIRNIRGELI